MVLECYADGEPDLETGAANLLVEVWNRTAQHMAAFREYYAAKRGRRAESPLAWHCPGMA